jgi:hypothetical protein
MHLSPAATEDAIGLLDGRHSGLEPLENLGDTFDTRTVGKRSAEVHLRANALRRDNFRMIIGARKLQRATGIETDQPCFCKSVMACDFWCNDINF